MSELQKELDRLEENCYQIDKLFDTGEECLEYCEKQIHSLNEEAVHLENSMNKFSDIINGYDDYHDCFKEYVEEHYIDFFSFIVIECVVYLMSLIIIIKTPLLLGKIGFLIAIVIVSLFNFGIKKKVLLIRDKIKDDIYSKYNIDLISLTEEDVDDMEMSLLKNKVREVKLNKEIEEFEFYIDWKKRKMERGY